MKWGMILTSIMLMLLPLPVQAKKVYITVVSADLVRKVRNWDDLDVHIRTHNQGLANIFPNGQLLLQSDQALLIRGGRGSIVTSLEPVQRFKDSPPN